MSRKTDTLRNLIDYLRPYVDVSLDEAAGFAPYVSQARYQAGSWLFREGQVCRDVVILGSGLVRAFYVHENKEVNLRLLCAPAAAVALASLIRQQPAAESLQAVSDSSGYRVRLADYGDAHPGALTERLRRVLAEQHYISMDRRLRMLQWKSAAERYAYFREHMEPAIVEGMPGYHVASYLGVAPESLSRIRSTAARSQPGHGKRRS